MGTPILLHLARFSFGEVVNSDLLQLVFATMQVLIEIPYTLVQSVLYTSVTYSLINLEWKADKFFLYLHFTFTVIMLFIYYGMMTEALTPNLQLGALFCAFFFNIWNMFCGFIIAKPVSLSRIYQSAARARS